MKSTIFKMALPAFLLLLFTFTANAQLPKAIDSLAGKMSLYDLKNQSPVLFIHFDKNVYANNEQVWFTAYLLNIADYRLYKTLSLALVRDDDRAVFMENKFFIKNGLAFGNATIPNSPAPGNYSFIATANVLKNGQPDAVFIQPITIKSEDEQEFTGLLTPIDTSITTPQQKVRLMVNFINQNPVQAKANAAHGVQISYYVGSNVHPVIKGFGETQAGIYDLVIPSKLLSQGNNVLHVQLWYEDKVKEISMALPARQNASIVSFYPEGGNMINNIPGNIGWEVKNTAGKPLGTSALLYQDNKIIDTLTTNSYGLGKFQLTPKAGSNYYVKLYGVNRKDTVYNLPAAIKQGPAISLPRSLVNDTLIVTIKDTQHEKLYLIGHNYKQLFFTTPVNMATATKTIKLIIKDIPKGLAQLTLTDSQGRPFAERIFFAHYDQRTTLNIATDKNEYATRQKVNVKIKLDVGKADAAFVSIACVQENRVEIKKKNDIEDYFYLKPELEDMPIRETYLRNNEADRQFLEAVLLIKGWRRYSWTDMLKTKPADTIHKYTDMAFKGTVTQLNSVTQLNEPLTNPVTLINISRPVNGITTDKTGAFILTDADLLTDSGKKANFMVRVSDPKNYTIRLADPYTEINEILAAQLQPKDYTSTGQEGTQYMQVPDNEHARHLKEVDIKGNNDNSFYGKGGKNGQGDNTFTYTEYINPTISDRINYSTTGPKEYVLQLNGIYAAREFYSKDYSKTPQEPEYLSTLYWKHLVKISPGTDTEFSFYTGDITGKFKIVVQGITGNDVTYGEATFTVAKPK
jgi:hypothetical protein